jgi:hypothetical protein
MPAAFAEGYLWHLQADVTTTKNVATSFPYAERIV